MAFASASELPSSVPATHRLFLSASLPRLRRALQPYIAAGAEPYLVDLAADLGRNITLRLSDKSCVELPLGLDLTAALEQLESACSDRSGQVG